MKMCVDKLHCWMQIGKCEIKSSDFAAWLKNEMITYELVLRDAHDPDVGIPSLLNAYIVTYIFVSLLFFRIFII